MTGISQTPNQELRDVEKRDNHRNFITSMRLIIGNVKENPLLFNSRLGLPSLPGDRYPLFSDSGKRLATLQITQPDSLLARIL